MTQLWNQKTLTQDMMRTEKLKFLTWNVKGINRVIKRKKVWLFLQKQNCDICCVQETHIQKSDLNFLKNPKLGHCFAAGSDKKKKGVALYIKQNLPSQEVLNDPNGHYIAVLSQIQNQKTLILGIYAPNEKKDRFYVKLLNKIKEISFDNIVALGDWNGVINPSLDRFSDKKIKNSQGKLPKSFFDLMDFCVMEDGWRSKYDSAKSYTFFSEVHHSWARLDMFLVSKGLCPRIKEIEVLPKVMSDHNPVVMTLLIGHKAWDWKLNNLLLKNDRIVQEAKVMLTNYFKENTEADTNLNTIWDASKAVMRGFFIQKGSELKKKSNRENLKSYKIS